MNSDVFNDPLLKERPFVDGKLYHGLSAHHSFTVSDKRNQQIKNEKELIRKQLLETDLKNICKDALIDTNVRKKLGVDASTIEQFGDSSLVSNSEHKPAAEFAKASWDSKIRMILHEILRVEHLATVAPTVSASKWEWKVYPSEIFSASSCIDAVYLIVSTFVSAFESVISPEVFCRAVLRLPHGLWFIGQILKENPEHVLPFCDFLTQQCTGEDLEDPASIFYSRVLAYLGRIFPNYLLYLRLLAINRQKYFNLVLYTTLQQFKVHGSNPELGVCLSQKSCLEKELADLFYELLVAPENDSKAKLWAASNIRLAGQASNPQFEECRLQLLIHAYNILPADSLFLPDQLIPSAIRIIRIFVNLKESANLSLTTEEYRVLAKLIMCRTAISPSGNSYVVLGLCCFTAFPDLFVDHVVAVEFGQWIQWQLNVDVAELEEQSPTGGTFLEVLLLIASHLRASQYKDITEILSGYLEVKIHLRGNMVVKLKNTLFPDVFKEETLLMHSLRVPPTKDLNAAFQSALPLNCIYSLLQNKSFASSNISVKDWILNQVRKCSLPIHPMIIHVLALYVQATLPVVKKALHCADEYICHQLPFSSTEILSIIFDKPDLSKGQIKTLRTVDLFKEDRMSEPYSNVPKILMAFFVLAYNEFYRTNLRLYLLAKSQCSPPYGMEVIEKIPFKQFLALTVQYHNLFDPLDDILGRLILQVLPQLRTVFDQVESTWTTDTPIKTVVKIPVLSLASVGDICRYLDGLARLPRHAIGGCMDDFLLLLPRVLHEDLNSTSLNAFEKVWMQLADIDPNALLLATTNTFLTEEKMIIPLTFQDLCFEPLHILRCDQLVFQKAHLTRIVIRTFAFFLAASKNYITQQLEEIDQKELLKTSVDVIDAVREERKRAMFHLQSSVAAQIFIEHCVAPKRDVDDFRLPKTLPENQTAICTYIHQLIIGNPALAKLVVFQGFPSSSIPSIVRGVESLHITFDYLHEAMALPSIEKKLFVLELTSYLCVKFRISRTLIIAKLAVDVIFTMLCAYPQSIRKQVIQVGSACLARFGNIFPPLRDDCLDILDLMMTLENAGTKSERIWMSGVKSLLGTNLDKPKSFTTLLKSAKMCASGKVPLNC